MVNNPITYEPLDDEVTLLPAGELSGLHIGKMYRVSDKDRWSHIVMITHRKDGVVRVRVDTSFRDDVLKPDRVVLVATDPYYPS